MLMPKIKNTAVLVACTGFAFAGAAQAAAPGEGYVVDGRCVTVTVVQGEQVSYEWREGNTSGSGSLPAGWLGARCAPGSGRAPSAAQPARPGQAPTPSAAQGGGSRAPAAGGPAAGAATGGFAQQILQAHNRYRCMHGVPPLQWSNEVAAYAQRWIEKHPEGRTHSDSYQSPLGPLGENLYWSSRAPDPADAPDDWYSESKGYVYGRETQRGMTGHFTAMIWKDARFLGCGISGGAVSCNYAPASRDASCGAPNTRGCYAQQVLPVTRDAGSCR